MPDGPPQLQNAPLNTDTMPSGMAPTAQPPQQQAPAAPQQTPQQTDMAHHALLGKAVSALMGSSMSYEVDPQTGKTVATPQKQSPGQWGKSMVLGAMLGLAAGSDGPAKGGSVGGFMGGFGRGGAAVAQHGEQMDQLRMSRAQEQFKNENQAKGEQRSAQAFQTEEQHKQAMIAAENAQTLRTQQIMKGETLDNFKKEAENGQAKVEPYKVAGLQPNAVGKTPDELHEIIKANPKAIAWDWEQTGWKNITLPDGKQDHVPTFDAYDPNQKVPITTGFLKLLKDSKMDDLFPGTTSRLKEGQELSPVEFSALKGQYQKAYNDKLEKDKNQAVLDDLKSQEKERTSIAKKNDAEAAKFYSEAQAMKMLGTPVSANFKPDPGAFTKSEADLRTELGQQGQSLPADFATLYSIGHYDGKINTNYSNRPYNRPGTPPQKSSSQATAFIRTFINPNYDEKNYEAVQKMQIEYASTKQNTAGGNGIAFNTGIRHLGMMYDAALALHNHDTVALNAALQYFGQQTGKNVKPNFDAIKAALVGELGKTFKGVAADIPERQDIEKTISSSGSPDQLLRDGVLLRYAQLMRSKVDVLDNHYLSLTGRHAPGLIDAESDKVYQKLTGSTQNPQKQNQPQLTGLIQDPASKQIIGWDGKQWVDSTTRQPVGSK